MIAPCRFRWPTTSVGEPSPSTARTGRRRWVGSTAVIYFIRGKYSAIVLQFQHSNTPSVRWERISTGGTWRSRRSACSSPTRGCPRGSTACLGIARGANWNNNDHAHNIRHLTRTTHTEVYLPPHDGRHHGGKQTYDPEHAIVRQP